MRPPRTLMNLGLLALVALVVPTLVLPRPNPASAADVAAVAAGSASSHTCAPTTTGGVKCWGRNDYGQLGDGTTTDRTTPADVVGLASGVVAVAAGSGHSCALTAAGAAKCWGRNNYGQLGDGRTCGIVCVTPVDVVGLGSGVVAIGAGYAHTCALTAAGGVKCWGNNFHGQLGNGQLGDFRTTPTDVGLLASGVADVAVGDWHTCAVTTAGGVKCWGENLHGQVGDGTAGNNRAAPVDVSGLDSDVAAVAAGGLHTCALTMTGGVKCWGRDDYGQLGDGTVGGIRVVPVDVVGLGTEATALAVGYRHSCAMTAPGGVRCWGRNEFGQLGDGTSTDRYAPVDVTGLTSGVAAVAAGGYHTCVATTAGGIKCWGQNQYGQLGDETTTDRSTASDVAGLGPKPTPTATPTSTPATTPAPTAASGPVGGIAELPEVEGLPLETHRPSGLSAGVVVTALAAGAAGAMALGAAAWYARRRR